MTEPESSRWIQSLLGSSADPVAAGTTLQNLGAMPPDQLTPMLATLADNASLLPESDPAILGGLMLAIQQVAAREMAVMAASPGKANSALSVDAEDRQRGEPSSTTSAAERPIAPSQLRLSELDVQAVCTIADHLPAQTPNRHRLLYLLAAFRSAEAIQALAQQLCHAPPGQWQDVGQVLSPLMQHQDWEPLNLFPKVLDGLAHPSVASPVLDLANFLHRNNRTEDHPATSRREHLVKLLGAVVGRLAKFEDDPRSMGDSVEQIQLLLSEAVALAVSLCDALGLIGWDGATGKLYQAMELRHRRVQCEAAGALARLNVGDGRQRLLELAAEPSARLRVIAYAEELGFDHEIDEAFKTKEAEAEAEMALWLSQPTNMGLPPSKVEMIEARQLYWPSYEQPIDCYLVRFEYEFGDRVYSNVGITGPTVFALGADLADLPHDDIYAVYAGWQAEHDDIFTVSSKNWNAAHKRLAAPLIDTLDRQGFEEIDPQLIGFFLDEHAMIAAASRHDTRCIVVTDGLETIDYSTQGRLRPMTGDDIWYLYLGRKMLRTFNS